MASNPANIVEKAHPTTVSRREPQARRKFSLRKKKLPTVRLGGGKNINNRRRFSVAKLFRRVKLRWLKVQYTCLLKKMREYYQSAVKDIMENGGALDSFQQRLLLETSFAVPVMGLSFNTFPNHYGT
ncbi:uncharacterized protein LOC107022886 [Solanum pennellii]|uniref:Uncharacterized protein LOC107022886 n=1 Tax=Solanum pennellii TaxID=28526 RepID=A0ABM1H186_SOLPN|nr:uncharacterized protein LOC107022886 [Solanum pennellii]